MRKSNAHCQGGNRVEFRRVALFQRLFDPSWTATEKLEQQYCAILSIHNPFKELQVCAHNTSMDSFLELSERDTNYHEGAISRVSIWSFKP